MVRSRASHQRNLYLDVLALMERSSKFPAIQHLLSAHLGLSNVSHPDSLGIIEMTPLTRQDEGATA